MVKTKTTKYISQKARNKADKGFEGGSEKLKKITRGANTTLRKIYGDKYRMNTKAVGKELGLKKKHQPK